MSVRIDASSESLSRARLTGAKTVMGWFRIGTDRNTYSVFLAAGDSALVGTASDGTTLLFWDGATERTGAALTVGTWYHVALTTTGDTNTSTFVVYLDGVSSISGTRGANDAGTNLYIGNDAFGEWLNGNAAHVKIWDAVLSAAEIQQEIRTIRPQRLANLYLWTPLLSHTDVADYSGNGRSWTANGTLTTEDNPPVAWGAPVLVPQAGAAASSTAVMTPAVGAATTGNLTGSARAIATIAAAAGSATTATLTGSGATGSAISPAAGVASASALAGSSRARASIGSATGTASGAAMSGRSRATSGIGAAVGAAATGTLTGIGVGWHLRFYGTASGQIDRVRIPLRSGGSPTAVDVGAGDFTYEFWLRALYADNATSGIADVRYSNIVFDRDAWNSPRGHVIGVTRRSGVLVACFGVAGTGLTWTTQYGSRNVGDGQPHHIALVRRQSTGVMELYVDGVLDASGTYTTGDLSYDGSNAGGQDNNAIILGTEKHDVGFGFAGRFDSLRISNHRRYTGTFAPPTRLSRDGSTVGLYQFNASSGTRANDDASSVHGELLVGGANNGPTWQLSELAPIASTITAASGVATAGTLVGVASGSDTATIAPAAGLATGATLTGSARAIGAISPASGAATPAVLAGSSVATGDIAASSGVASGAALSGAGRATSAVSPAAGIATAATLTGLGSASNTASITPAAGAASGAALSGSSVATASLTPAASTATTGTLPGVGTVRAVIAPATGTATPAILAGRALARSVIAAALGTATPGALFGASIARAAITPAAGLATSATLTPAGLTQAGTLTIIVQAPMIGITRAVSTIGITRTAPTITTERIT